MIVTMMVVWYRSMVAGYMEAKAKRQLGLRIMARCLGRCYEPSADLGRFVLRGGGVSQHGAAFKLWLPNIAGKLMQDIMPEDDE